MGCGVLGLIGTILTRGDLGRQGARGRRLRHRFLPRNTAPQRGEGLVVKTIVLDDDPTGTQSASGVMVLLECSADRIEEVLRDAESVYVQTNSPRAQRGGRGGPRPPHPSRRRGGRPTPRRHRPIRIARRLDVARPRLRRDRGVPRRRRSHGVRARLSRRWPHHPRRGALRQRRRPRPRPRTKASTPPIRCSVSAPACSSTMSPRSRSGQPFPFRCQRCAMAASRRC